MRLEAAASGSRAKRPSSAIAAQGGAYGPVATGVGDRVEVGRVRPVAAVDEQALEAELHARVVLALLRAQRGVDLEAPVLLCQQIAHVRLGDGGGAAVQRAWRDRVDLRP